MFVVRHKMIDDNHTHLYCLDCDLNGRKCHTYVKRFNSNRKNPVNTLGSDSEHCMHMQMKLQNYADQSIYTILGFPFPTFPNILQCMTIVIVFNPRVCITFFYNYFSMYYFFT